MNLLKRLLYGGRPVLRDYEQIVLDALSRRLTDAGGAILKAQLSVLDVVQRASNDKLVTFYFADNVLLFPNTEPELHVARALLSVGGSEVDCDVMFHRGRLSSLEFHRSPRNIAGPNVSCRRVDLFGDPMQTQISASGEVPLIQATLLANVTTRVHVRSVEPPAAEHVRAKALALMEKATLPVDYVDLLSQTDGFTSGMWRFAGTNVRTIVLPDVTYYVLAERLDSQAAICAINSKKPALILYDELDDRPEPWTGTFIDLFVTVATRDKDE